MSSLLYGLQNYKHQVGKSKEITLTEHVLRENLKFSNDEVKDITDIAVGAEKLYKILTNSKTENE